MVEKKPLFNRKTHPIFSIRSHGYRMAVDLLTLTFRANSKSTVNAGAGVEDVHLLRLYQGMQLVPLVHIWFTRKAG